MYLLLQLVNSPVEEELVVHEGVVWAELHDLGVGSSPGEEAESRGRKLLQHPPEHLVSHAAHVERDSLVQLAGLGNNERVGGGLLGNGRRTWGNKEKIKLLENRSLSYLGKNTKSCHRWESLPRRRPPEDPRCNCYCLCSCSGDKRLPLLRQYPRVLQKPCWVYSESPQSPGQKGPAAATGGGSPSSCSLDQAWKWSWRHNLPLHHTNDPPGELVHRHHGVDAVLPGEGRPWGLVTAHAEQALCRHAHAQAPVLLHAGFWSVTTCLMAVLSQQCFIISGKDK